VHIALVQNDGTITDPPLYGDGTTSPGASAGVAIDAPSLTATQSDFQANWNSSAPIGQPQANVGYNGGDSIFLEHAHDWQFVLSNDGGTTHCGASFADLSETIRAVTIDVAKSCIENGGTFTANISFAFYSSRHSFTVDISGSAPEPVDPTKITFNAEWTNPLLGRSQVRVEYAGPYDQDTIDSLRWHYAISSDQSPGVDCLVGGDYPDPAATGNGPDLDVAFTRCPSNVGGTAAIYTLTVSFTDPNYGVVGGPYSPQVEGSP
jgi:hypothetical protein